MKKNIVLKIIVTLIGLAIAGMGVGIFLYSQLGVDPASVFQTGLSNVFGISYGTASALSNVIILMIVFIIDKKYINIASILAIFAIGYTADFTSVVLSIIFPNELSLVVRIIMILVGTVIMAIGIATYIRAELGVGAIDLISEIISDRSKMTYKFVRIIADLSLVIVGYLLGGEIGVGTVVAAFLTGPVVQFVRPTVHSLVDKVVKKEGGVS